MTATAQYDQAMTTPDAARTNLSRWLSIPILFIGVAVVVQRWFWWQPCGSSPTSTVGESTIHPTVSDACLNAMSDSPAHLFIFNVAALVIAMVAAAAARTIYAFAAVALIIIANPLFDPGFFWQGWDTADLVPGHGILMGVAFIVAAALLGFTRPKPLPSENGQQQPSATSQTEASATSETPSR